jgi:hypothetical protein
MRKPDGNFKMPNKFKALVRLYKGPESTRSLWKHSFIQASLAMNDYQKTKQKGE